MNFDDVEVFVEVVDAQSFSRAARRLKMPATTVSAKLSRLEADLGATLLRRTTRRLTVTEVGRAYYKHCIAALKALEAGRQGVKASSEEPIGPLRITAAGDIALGLLSPVIEKFLSSFPKASVDLVVTSHKIDLIAENIDLAVRAGPLADSTLIAKKFMKVKVSLWAAPSYLEKHGVPKSPSDLKLHQFARFRLIPEDLKLRADIRRLILNTPTRLLVDDFMFLKSFLLHGNGIGFLPDFLVEGRLQSGGRALVRVLEECSVPGSELFLCYPQQRFLSPAVREFLKIAVPAKQ